MSRAAILSHYQTDAILKAHKAAHERITTTLDLGRTQVELELAPDGLRLLDGTLLDWAALKKVSDDQNKCYYVAAGTLRPVMVHSNATNWVRTLYPTKSWPTTLVAGFLMHRIKEIDPQEDTRRKIAAVAPFTGEVLDTATGLGYTAILAAPTASHITTIELDPAALELAQLNPWSQELFTNPKITQIVGDSTEVVQQFADGQFNRILHDPPTFSLGGELYSALFYAQLYRVLARRGQLFHYIGDMGSNYGSRTLKGVIRRLQEAGFSKVLRKDEAFGLVASKLCQPHLSLDFKQGRLSDWLSLLRAFVQHLADVVFLQRGATGAELGKRGVGIVGQPRLALDASKFSTAAAARDELNLCWRAEGAVQGVDVADFGVAGVAA